MVKHLFIIHAKLETAAKTGNHPPSATKYGTKRELNQINSAGIHTGSL
jgi:hypothetical protein